MALSGWVMKSLDFSSRDDWARMLDVCPSEHVLKWWLYWEKEGV